MNMNNNQKLFKNVCYLKKNPNPSIVIRDLLVFQGAGLFQILPFEWLFCFCSVYSVVLRLNRQNGKRLPHCAQNKVVLARAPSLTLNINTIEDYVQNRTLKKSHVPTKGEMQVPTDVQQSLLVYEIMKL